MGNYTDFLYARPSFLEGMARTLDIGGTLNSYNRSQTPEKADRLALEMDMRAIAEDLLHVMQRTSDEREHLVSGNE